MKGCRKNLLKLIGLFLLLLIASIIFISRFQGHNVVTPTRNSPSKTPADYDIVNWEDVTFQSSDGLNLRGFFIPPDPNSNGATIIFVHGLTSNRAGLLEQANLLVKHGYGAFLIELRGHGDSDGDVTTLGYIEVNDVEGALAYLKTRFEVNYDHLGIVGQSLGCITSLRATARFPEIDALVAEVCLTSIRDNVEDGVRTLANLPAFPFAPLVIYFGSQKAGVDIDLVAPIEDVDAIAPRPILFIHGTDDTLMRVENSERLFAEADGPKELYIIEGAGHYPLYSEDPIVFEEKIVSFFQTNLPNR